MTSPWDRMAACISPDTGNHRIRRVGTDGIITTVAGNGNYGFSGDGGPAATARVSVPLPALPWDRMAACTIADTSTTAFAAWGPMASSPRWRATATWLQRRRWPGDPGRRLLNPYGVAVGPDGSLYIVDMRNHRIRRVGPDGIITTVAGNGRTGFSGDGGPATGGGTKRAPWRCRGTGRQPVHRRHRQQPHPALRSPLLRILRVCRYPAVHPKTAAKSTSSTAAAAT